MKRSIKRAGNSHSPALIPNPKQIENAKSYQKRSTLIFGDVFQNISLQHSDFVQKIEWSPIKNSLFFVLATARQLQLLITNCHTLYVDGTFDVTEQELILTIFMIKINGFGIPVLWFLHNCRDTETYQSMWRVVKVILKYF